MKDKKIEKVFVGKISDISKHPNADSLVVCLVDMGISELDELQIITGATNITVGDIVPVAIHGAKVVNPDTGEVKKIKKGKLRGIESQGMLCSAEELGITGVEEGILILGEGYGDKIGAELELENFK